MPHGSIRLLSTDGSFILKSERRTGVVADVMMFTLHVRKNSDNALHNKNLKMQIGDILTVVKMRPQDRASGMLSSDEKMRAREQHMLSVTQYAAYAPRSGHTVSRARVWCSLNASIL